VPCGPARPAAAVEAARAGAIAVLDLAHFVPDREGVDSLDHVLWTADRLAGDERIGLRLDPAAIRQHAQHIEALAGFDATLIITEWPQSGDADCDLPKGWRVLVETRSLDAYGRLAASRAPIAGVIACGNESGGEVEDDSTFILLQKLAR